jgi:predicted CoA-binding protein
MEMMKSKLTAVLGASVKPERYSNKALRMLREHGHAVIPVHPLHKEIEGIPAVASVAELPREVDTVTMYLGPAASESVADALVALIPRRVIFNPGSESAPLEERLRQAGVEVERACTLVLLQTGQY